MERAARARAQEWSRRGLLALAGVLVAGDASACVNALLEASSREGKPALFLGVVGMGMAFGAPIAAVRLATLPRMSGWSELRRCAMIAPWAACAGGILAFALDAETAMFAGVLPLLCGLILGGMGYRTSRAWATALRVASFMAATLAASALFFATGVWTAPAADRGLVAVAAQALLVLVVGGLVIHALARASRSRRELASLAPVTAAALVAMLVASPAPACGNALVEGASPAMERLAMSGVIFPLALAVFAPILARAWSRTGQLGRLFSIVAALASALGLSWLTAPLMLAASNGTFATLLLLPACVFALDLAWRVGRRGRGLEGVAAAVLSVLAPLAVTFLMFVGIGVLDLAATLPMLLALEVAGMGFITALACHVHSGPAAPLRTVPST